MQIEIVIELLSVTVIVCISKHTIIQVWLKLIFRKNCIYMYFCIIYQTSGFVRVIVILSWLMYMYVHEKKCKDNVNKGM